MSPANNEPSRQPSRRSSRQPRIARALTFGAMACLAAATVGCSSEAAPSADPTTYRTELAAVCTTSQAERSAVSEPVDTAGVTAFARTIAEVLTREADAARALQVPADLDADHRAFVQNTADQAAGWTALAAVPPDDAEQFSAVQTTILELTLGRDDLATEMGVPACRVTAE